MTNIELSFDEAPSIHLFCNVITEKKCYKALQAFFSQCIWKWEETVCLCYVFEKTIEQLLWQKKKTPLADQRGSNSELQRISLFREQYLLLFGCVCYASESLYVCCSASTLFILQWFAVLFHVFFTLAFLLGFFCVVGFLFVLVLGCGLGFGGFFEQKRLSVQMYAMILLA